MVRVSIVGATGYTGVELIRWLIRHPRVKLACLTTRREKPPALDDLLPALPKGHGLRLTRFEYKAVRDASDVVFLALPHTEGGRLAERFLRDRLLVIDLSADFRLKDARLYRAWYGVPHPSPKLLARAAYGLPELYRSEIRAANLISNPGCYATSVILALAPLLERNLIDREFVVADCKSGASGAGRTLRESTHFCRLDENFEPYKVNQHQHMPEIEQALSDVSGARFAITFVPHLLPVDRGILATVYARRRRGARRQDIDAAFREAYEGEPFVRLRASRPPSLKDVQNTNYCDLSVVQREGRDEIVVMAALDNLVKGASGQAVQNMNIRCGFPEEEALR